LADKNNVVVDNPNLFFVFAFDDGDLPGFVPQRIREFSDREFWDER
jgi:hypothetical protein